MVPSPRQLLLLALVAVGAFLAGSHLLAPTAAKALIAECDAWECDQDNGGGGGDSGWGGDTGSGDGGSADSGWGDSGWGGDSGDSGWGDAGEGDSGWGDPTSPPDAGTDAGYPPFDMNDPSNCCDETRPDYEENWEKEAGTSGKPDGPAPSGWPDHGEQDAEPGYPAWPAYPDGRSDDPNCDETGCTFGYNGYPDPSVEYEDRVKTCKFGLSPQCDSFCLGNREICEGNRQRERDQEAEHRIDREIQEYEERQQRASQRAHPHGKKRRASAGRGSRR